MTQTLMVGVKAILLWKGQALLMRRSDKYETASSIWDIPGGRIDFGEEPEVGLRREIEEETGIPHDTFMINRILDASTIFKSDEKHIVRITYLCELNKEPKIELSDEHTEIKWADPYEERTYKDQLMTKCFTLLKQERKKSA